jgi:thioredoxin-like negative regulator of GroEL
MKYLMQHEELEDLLGRGENASPDPHPFTVIYFTANWCGACRNLNLSKLVFETSDVNWLKCDVDQNNHSAGYCGVRSIPSFIAIKDKKVVGSLQSNDTDAVVKWANNLV